MKKLFKEVLKAILTYDVLKYERPLKPVFRRVCKYC